MNQKPKHGVGIRNVDVSLLLVVIAKRRHVLGLPLLVALHDLLIAQVQSSHPHQLVLVLRRNGGVSGPDTTHQRPNHGVGLRNVDVFVDPVKVAEGRHVLGLPLLVALHDHLIAQVQSHLHQLLLVLRRNGGVSGPDTTHQSPKHGVGIRNVDVSLLLVVIAKGRHVLGLKPLRTCLRICLSYRDQPCTTLPTLRAVPSVVVCVKMGNKVFLLEVHPFCDRSQRVVAEGGRTRCRCEGTTTQYHERVLCASRVVPVKGRCSIGEVLFVACGNVLNRLPHIDRCSMNG